MIQFRFQKISLVPENFFKKRAKISQYLKKLREVLKEKNYNFPESFLILPQENFSLKSFGDFSLILLCGIGGSSLGTQAIYEALKNKRNLKEILVLDSLNPILMRKALLKVEEIPKGKVALFFISKSGKTFETIANFFTLFKIIKKYQPRVFIISERNSPLWNFGKKKKFLTFEVPEKVGGRYSVFSNVGILTLFLAGVKIKELLLGGKMANQICLNDDPLKNPALSSSLTIFYHYRKGKNIYSNLVFPPDLEYFGKWYVQLMGESLGKDDKGITPTVALGTSDLHSVGQLFFDGPRDKLINFVFVKDLDFYFEIGDLEDFNKIFPAIKKESLAIKQSYF
jgi:glucose-6-phosphate isomerase